MKSPTANLKSLPNMERHEIAVDPPTLPNHSENDKGISQVRGHASEKEWSAKKSVGYYIQSMVDRILSQRFNW